MFYFINAILSNIKKAVFNIFSVYFYPKNREIKA